MDNVQASRLAPKDESIRFNISLIRQRGLELLQGLAPAKRRFGEIHTALSDAEAAQEYVYATSRVARQIDRPFADLLRS